MKITQISNNVWSLKIWMLIPVTVWIVKEEDGLTLVDAGIPNMAKGILNFIAGLNEGPLRRIALTHGHSDHVGAIARLREAYPDVAVLVHRIEIPYMEGAEPYPRRKKAAASVTPGVAQPLAEQLPEGADGRKSGSLSRIGSLQPYWTPGHSPGHVAYYHVEDRVMMAGDLFTAKKGKLRQPMKMFTADMEEAVRSSVIVEQLRPERLEVCHGTPVLHPAEQIPAYLGAARGGGKSTQVY